jgi:AhpD family alkylhydroperoxidase
MKTLKPLKKEEASFETQQIFAELKSKIGMVPKLYAAMGESDKLLSGYLNFVETLKTGEFSGKEYEAIALITSEKNHCDYCISAHTTLGKMQGFSERETLEIRQNSVLDKRLYSLVNLASEIISKNGYPSESTVSEFFHAGYSKAAFAELIAIVTITTLTNYIHHNGKFEIDFPKAQPLNKQVA